MGKGDEIAIYCPEAAQTKLVDYKITPAADDPKHSSLVEKVNSDEAGLQWGTEETHYFYGFYPASAVTGTEKGKIKGKIPVVQDPESWKLIVNEKEERFILGWLTRIMPICGLLELLRKKMVKMLL